MTEGMWVFGYGSLMWRPGFPYTRRMRARVQGFTRRLCVLSVHHRGTERRPGLVLGLDRGGACDGIAYWVPQEEVKDVRDYLRAREQVNGVYREARIRMSLSHEQDQDTAQGVIDLASAQPNLDEVWATTFIAERAHPSYQPELRLCEQAQIVSGAAGLSGHNVGYVVNTVTHLRELSIHDAQLERLLVVLGTVLARSNGTATGLSHHAPIVTKQLPRRLKHKPMRTDQRRRFSYRSQLTD
ncbi:MAG: gamma-glutamylcyclotransferase [Pseudomonadota bacterium]